MQHHIIVHMCIHSYLVMSIPSLVVVVGATVVVTKCSQGGFFLPFLLASPWEHFDDKKYLPAFHQTVLTLMAVKVASLLVSLGLALDMDLMLQIW